MGKGVEDGGYMCLMFKGAQIAQVDPNLKCNPWGAKILSQVHQVLLMIKNKNGMIFLFSNPCLASSQIKSKVFLLSTKLDDDTSKIIFCHGCVSGSYRVSFKGGIFMEKLEGERHQNSYGCYQTWLNPGDCRVSSNT